MVLRVGEADLNSVCYGMVNIVEFKLDGTS